MDVGAIGGDGARATVVADRDPPPVRQQRVAVGPEQPTEVGRVMDRRVEVDVVDRRGRHAHRQRHSRHDHETMRRRPDRVGDQLGEAISECAPHRRTGSEVAVEAGPGETAIGQAEPIQPPRLVRRRQVDRRVADRHPRPRSAIADMADAQRQVGDREGRPWRDVDHRLPRRSCSRSIDSNSALKLPSPNPRAPPRWMISMNTVGRSVTGSVNNCRRCPSGS